jgi:hypothetical protein
MPGPSGWSSGQPSQAPSGIGAAAGSAWAYNADDEPVKTVLTQIPLRIEPNGGDTSAASGLREATSGSTSLDVVVDYWSSASHEVHVRETVH